MIQWKLHCQICYGILLCQLCYGSYARATMLWQFCYGNYAIETNLRSTHWSGWSNGEKVSRIHCLVFSLSIFVHILIFRLFLAFFVNRMDKTEKSSKMLGNFLVDFLPILYQKVKNYFWLSKKHPLATIESCN